MEYDATRSALLRPGDATQYFLQGRPDSDAALCAEMSRLSYCRDEETVMDNVAAIGFSGPHFFNEGGTQAILTASDDKAVLAFRGTESDDPTDLVIDALFLPEAWEAGGKVHTGFAKALEYVWSQILPHLQALNKPILFTGHSLGGALATLAASNSRPQTLYTYGSPRVGDSEFCRSLDGLDIHRYVDCCDLVCQGSAAAL